MIQLEDSPDGVLLRVRAQAGARASAVRGEFDGALKVAVTQVAEKGKANKAIISLLGEQLGVAKSTIELVAGATAANKRFLIRRISLDELRRRIEKTF